MTERTVSTATITTIEPARIILRLCKHWGHKFPVSYDDTQGRIELPLGLCLLTAGDGKLTARLEGVSGADMARFEEVVAPGIGGASLHELPWVSSASLACSGSRNWPRRCNQCRRRGRP